MGEVTEEKRVPQTAEEKKKKRADNRRYRYNNDDEYKARHKARCQRYYEKTGKKGRKERLAGKPKKLRKRGAPKMKLWVIDVPELGKVNIMMGTIGVLSKRLDRRPQTLKLWEERGVLPKAMYKGPGGVRLYTQLQIEAVVAVVTHYEISFKVHDLNEVYFRELIWDAWNALPHGLKQGRSENVTGKETEKDS